MKGVRRGRSDHAVDLVDALGRDNAKGEFYLSDIVDIARRKGLGRGTIELPAEELIGILLTQREMTSPLPPTVFRDFWTCAYQAIDD